MIDLKALFRYAQLFLGKPIFLVSDMLIMYWMVFLCVRQVVFELDPLCQVFPHLPCVIEPTNTKTVLEISGFKT